MSLKQITIHNVVSSFYRCSISRVRRTWAYEHRHDPNDRSFTVGWPSAKLCGRTVEVGELSSSGIVYEPQQLMSTSRYAGQLCQWSGVFMQRNARNERTATDVKARTKRQNRTERNWNDIVSGFYSHNLESKSGARFRPVLVSSSPPTFGLKPPFPLWAPC